MSVIICIALASAIALHFETQQINRETTAIKQDTATIEEQTKQLLRIIEGVRKNSELDQYHGRTGFETPIRNDADQCSRPHDYADSTVTFVVPAGWSIWSCVKARFEWFDDQAIASIIDTLEQQVALDPTQPVRDIDDVPVGYTFYTDLSGFEATPAPVHLQSVG